MWCCFYQRAGKMQRNTAQFWYCGAMHMLHTVTLGVTYSGPNKVFMLLRSWNAGAVWVMYLSSSPKWTAQPVCGFAHIVSRGIATWIEWQLPTSALACRNHRINAAWVIFKWWLFEWFSLGFEIKMGFAPGFACLRLALRSPAWLNLERFW